MAIKAKELRNKAKQNQSRMQELLKGEGALTPDQEKEFDALDKDAEIWLGQADKIEKMEKREITDSDGEEIQTNLKSKTIDQLKPEEKKKAEDLAMRSYLQTGSV